MSDSGWLIDSIQTLAHAHHVVTGRSVREVILGKRLFDQIASDSRALRIAGVAKQGRLELAGMVVTRDPVAIYGARFVTEEAPDEAATFEAGFAMDRRREQDEQERRRSEMIARLYMLIEHMVVMVNPLQAITQMRFRGPEARIAPQIEVLFAKWILAECDANSPWGVEFRDISLALGVAPSIRVRVVDNQALVGFDEHTMDALGLNWKSALS